MYTERHDWFADYGYAALAEASPTPHRVLPPTSRDSIEIGAIFQRAAIRRASSLVNRLIAERRLGSPNCKVNVLTVESTQVEDLALM